MPRLEVVVAGRDRQAYSYPAPSHEGSWKEHLLAELGPFEGRERVHFTGLIPYGQLRELYAAHRPARLLQPSLRDQLEPVRGRRLRRSDPDERRPATTGVLPGAAFATVDLDEATALPVAIQAALERSWRRAAARESRLAPEFALPALPAALGGRW